MNKLQRIWRYWRAGTLTARLSQRLGRRMPAAERVRWYGATEQAQAVRALLHWARERQTAQSGQLLLVGGGDDFSDAVAAAIGQAGLAYSRLTLEQALKLDQAQGAGISALICTARGADEQTRIATAVAAHPFLADKPFEYVYGLDPAMQIFRQWDEYADAEFVSPLLLDDPTPHALYEESLRFFEQKCGMRDYLDLYQVLRHIVDNGIQGDIAEFGSYKGHSGWLIARSLRALGDEQRRVFLFDTFAGFPEEKGVDHFWSHTHKVDYEAIRQKFADMPNVTLVKGDFTVTLPEQGLDTLALAYVDCDSHRATRWLIEALWPARIAARGAMVFEDYGHPALLGNRMAIHQAFPRDTSSIRFFSQFSGLYIAYRA